MTNDLADLGGHLRGAAQGPRQRAHRRSRHHHLVLQRRRAPAGAACRSTWSPSTSPTSRSSRCPPPARTILMANAEDRPRATPRPAATVVILRDGREGHGGLHGGAPPRDRFRLRRAGVSRRQGRRGMMPIRPGPSWRPRPPPRPTAPSWWRPRARPSRRRASMLARRGGGAGHGRGRRRAPAGRDLSRAPARGRDDLPRPRAQRGPAARHRPDGAVRALDHAGERCPSASTRTFCWSRRRSSSSAPTTAAESVEGLWIAPQQALRDAEAGTRTLVFPTQMNLLKLARYASVAEAVAATRASADRHRHAAGRAHGDGPHAAHPRRSRLRRHRVRRGDADAETIAGGWSVSPRNSAAGRRDVQTVPTQGRRSSFGSPVMLHNEMPCPKCSGKMQPGFIVDRFDKYIVSSACGWRARLRKASGPA